VGGSISPLDKESGKIGVVAFAPTRKSSCQPLTGRRQHVEKRTIDDLVYVDQQRRSRKPLPKGLIYHTARTGVRPIWHMQLG
jgi:hypothetical protein